MTGKWFGWGWLCLTGCWAGCGGSGATLRPETPADSGVAAFVRDHVARVAPLEKELNLAYWQATTQGSAAAYRKMADTQVALRLAHSDRAAYQLLKKALGSGDLIDPLLRRQVEKLVPLFEENQIPEEMMRQMVQLETDIQQIFNEHRAQVAGKTMTDNEIDATLRSSNDSALRQEAWEASKEKGRLIRDKLLDLVRLRNRAAVSLGYANYHQMHFRHQEQDPDDLLRLVDELARLTDAPFARLMDEIRARLAGRFGLKPAQLRPWHFGDSFFQKAQGISDLDLNPFFAGHDPRQVVATFFTAIDLDPADILERSDLYERPGKMPHAYCINVDRNGDVRILANLQNEEDWTSTLMHEMGHAVYDRYIDPNLPWLLREQAHSFVTEAVAMLFGRMTRNPAWLEHSLGVPAEQLKVITPEIRAAMRRSMLVFARFSMVMIKFEHALYQDPEQDLNALWWRLKKRYQLLDPPAGRDAPDWASKVHISAYPAYYHNYLLGELLASQFLDTIVRSLGIAGDPNQVSLAGREEVGQFLKRRVFALGASLPWPALIEKATGQPLSPRFFVQQFVEN